jgi:hypothetical protein
MYTKGDSITINQRFSIMASKYELHILDLYVDEYAIRINYKITPPVPYIDPEMEGALLFTWRGHAKDDSGNEYNSWGGACGLSSDGNFTDGVLSFTPIFEENILFLDVTFIPEKMRTGEEYSFRVTF